MNAVSSGGHDTRSNMGGNTVGMSALDAAAAASIEQMKMATNAATDVQFCGVDDPTCEACQ
jgi:ribonucleoside-diphosphate reductase alpha chain